MGPVMGHFTTKGTNMRVLDLITIQGVSDYLDRRFDAVGRLTDGSLCDSALDRTGFKWAVKELMCWLPISKDDAHDLVKMVKWF